METDDLPGALALQMGVTAQQWPHTMDAKAWADEWRRAVKNIPNLPNDDEAMLAWFANATMAGYDTAALRLSARLNAREVARRFHDAYESLAPSFGYKTRDASAKPWDELPANLRALMIATVERVLKEL